MSCFWIRICFSFSIKNTVIFCLNDVLFNSHNLSVILRANFSPSSCLSIVSSSSSSSRAGSTDIPDPLSPLLPIVHRPR